MLIELKVSNFAIIENIHIVFKNGLNIISGETGAGKSIVLKSMGLLMGGKATPEAIRSGAEAATIEGSFDISRRPDIAHRLKELGIEIEDDVLIVRRVISSQGKNVIYMNGSLNTLACLRDIVSPLIEVTGPSAPLIEMTGQHESRHLLAKSYHLDMLDQYAEAWELRVRYADIYEKIKTIEGEIQRLESTSRDRSQRLDFLEFQRDEIEKLGLQPGDEVELENAVRRMKNSSQIGEFIEMAECILSRDHDSVLNRMQALLQKSKNVGQLDSDLERILEPLEGLRGVVTDISYELHGYSSRLDANPQRLEELESQLSSLRKLQKKFGSDVTTILNSLESVKSEITELSGAEERIASLQKESEKLHKEVLIIGSDLHQIRTKAAVELVKAVNKELLDLNMKGVGFEIKVEKAQEILPTGLSDVEFMSQFSKTEGPRPLAKVASGGELSRILLSLKRVVGESRYPRTYLFDEVDTGVSGPTAEKVGRKLKVIAKSQQVICITHLPQVAAHGDVHFFIQKSPHRGQMQMEVNELSKESRVEEIARLISGEKISKTSLAHAKQLLADVR